MRRTERLFAITEYLRGRRTGVTAGALAERFGVGIRTIYRDLDGLREASLPLGAERGRGGGYALDRSYTLPPVNITAREAAVLLALGGWAVEARLVPFVDTLVAALDKVRGALSRSAQRELGERLATFHFVGVPARAAPPGVRKAVERAWFEGRALRVRYRGADGSLSERRVRLERFLIDRSATLLVAHDLDLGEPRQFRLDRVTWAAVERDGKTGDAGV